MNADAWFATASAQRLMASPIAGSVGWAMRRLAGEHRAPIDVLNELATAQHIHVASGEPLQFVSPSRTSKAFADQYEVRVHERGTVATRPDNWHDLLNGLVWLTFPRTKAILNARHYEEMCQRRGEPLRGPVRDQLTLFDEGGVIVATCAQQVRELLREHRWKDLFWRERAQLNATTHFLVFGHAILERAIEPFDGLTAKALVLDVDPSLLAADPEAQRVEIDRRSAAYFAAPGALAPCNKLGPLPVLGIPGWASGNAAATYYDDRRTFRPHPAARDSA